MIIPIKVYLLVMFNEFMLDFIPPHKIENMVSR
jgi:hypothetical protein